MNAMVSRWCSRSTGHRPPAGSITLGWFSRMNEIADHISAVTMPLA